MFDIYKNVNDIEINVEKYSFMAKFKSQQKKKTTKRLHRGVTIQQGILYSTIMILLYIFGLIIEAIAIVIKNKIVVMQMISFTILPLQGIFNMCMHLVPVF